MRVTSFNIILNSEDRERLYAFYRDVVGLTENDRHDGFDVAGAQILIDGHSEIAGPAKEPARVIVDLASLVARRDPDLAAAYGL